MTECRCTSPPCTCIPLNRDTTCEHQIKITDLTIKNKKKNSWYVSCNKDGKLRNDCNTFWEGKMVLCEEHYLEHKEECDRPCGICGTQIRSCVC